MTDHKTLHDEVSAALDALAIDPRDAAAAELARLYARRIDGASAAARQADKVLRAFTAAGDLDAVEAIGALRAKLGEQTALATLGKRLEDVLASLHATTAARSKAGTPAPATGGRLLAFRGGRAEGAS